MDELKNDSQRQGKVMVENNQVNNVPVAPIVTPPQNAVPVRPTPALPTVSGEDAVCLAADLYNRTRVLDMMYQQMRDISQSNRSAIQSLMTENKVAQAAVLNVYYSLSGEDNPPREKLTIPSLGNNFCSGLSVISDYLSGMIALNVRLQNAVNTPEISRQIPAISANLTSQKESINGLKRQC